MAKTYLKSKQLKAKKKNHANNNNDKNPVKIKPNEAMQIRNKTNKKQNNKKTFNMAFEIVSHHFM